MEFKLKSLIALLLSLGLVCGRNYMNCSKQTDAQMRCICYVRQYSKLYSDDCGATREIAKEAINYICRHNSDCKKGFVEFKDNNCSGYSCRNSCLISAYQYIALNYESAYDKYDFGIRLNTDDYPDFKQEVGVVSNRNEIGGHECASWRKEE